MATNDRSVGLAELAARAQAGPATRRARSDCRNPECQNGLTPGLVAAGGGSKGQPIFGAGGVGAKRLMRWGWVNCLVCNKSDDQRKAGTAYRDLNLSDAQISQRAQLASTKASYRPAENQPIRPGTPLRAPAPDNSKLTELLEQNKQLNERLGEVLKQNASMTDTLSRLTMQVAALLEDNAKLRAVQPAPPVTPPSAA
jgi:hypothetical protein